MRFDIITIFPKIFDSYLNESMIKRGRAKKLVDIRIHDLRKFSVGKPRTRTSSVQGRRQKVDDRPYGGGPGMVLQIEPLARALSSLRSKKQEARSKEKVPVILFSAGGKQFTSKHAAEWGKKYKQIIMLAGRYEGVDERVKSLVLDSKFLLLEVSIGPYVLSGGELPAMAVMEAVARHIPGFLGKGESLEERRHGVGVPVYTRPEIFTWKGKSYRVPKVLLTGNHKKVDTWRRRALIKHHSRV